MPFDSAAWIKRATDVVNKSHMGNMMMATEATQFATSMLTAVYGEKSRQLMAFQSTCDAIIKHKEGIGLNLAQHARGAINNAKAELEAGLTTRLTVQVAGEILSELVRLGKETLQDHSDSSKNVAAVLIAAAFEDLMRRMGEEFADVFDRPPLQDALAALKNAGVLKGGEIGTAQSFLKFRNDSLHANWANVSRAQVESCIAFVDAMLLKHFS